MQIELKSIKIQDLVDGYVNAPDAGVKGCHGKLDIRPPYQREFLFRFQYELLSFATLNETTPDLAMQNGQTGRFSY